jgi:hypothetical protein
MFKVFKFLPLFPTLMNIVKDLESGFLKIAFPALQFMLP